MERSTKIEFPSLGLVFTDGIEGGSLNLNQVLYTEDLRFGQLCANKFEVSLYGIEDISGQRVVVSQIVDGTEVKKFDGYVESAKLDEFGYYRHIVAYDKAYTVNQKDVVDWWKRFWSSRRKESTLKELRQSLLAEVGLNEVERNLFNDDFVISDNIQLVSAKFVDVFKFITELQGVMPNINADGMVEYIYPVSINEKKDIKNYYEKNNSTFEEYTSGFSGVHVTDSDGNIVYTVGKGNLFYTVSNMFLFDKNAEEIKDFADEFFERIKNIKTVPSNIKMIYSNPSIELGDLVESSNGVHIVSSIDMSGIMLIEQSLKSEGQPQREVQESSYRFDMQVLKGKTAKLKSDLDGLEAEFGEFEKDTNEKYSSLKMDTDGLQFEVASLQKQVDGSTEFYEVTYTPDLENYPAWDFTYNIVCDDSIEIGDGDLGFVYKDDYWKRNAGAMARNMETYDTYRFRKDENTGIWYWDILTNTDFGVVMKRVTEVELTVEGLGLKVEESKQYVDNSVDELATYVTTTASGLDVKITKTRDDLNSKINTTKDDLQTQITAVAGKIDLKVSKGDVISQINLEPEGAMISASKIDLYGYVTVKDLSGTSTTINGANIKTGTISTSRLESKVITTDNFSAQKINANNITSGTISTSRLESKVITTDNLSAKTISGSQINGGTISGQTISGGIINAPTINLGTAGRINGAYSGSFIFFGADSQKDYCNIRIANTDMITVYPSSVSIRGTTSISGGLSVSGGTSVNQLNLSGATSSATSGCIDFPPFASSSYKHCLLIGGANASGSVANIYLPSKTGTLALVGSSDERIKKDIKDSNASGLELINKIKLHEFTYIENDEHWDCGFVAQELKALDEKLINFGSGTDEVDERGILQNPYSINTFYMTGYIVKAIQELNEKIERMSK